MDRRHFIKGSGMAGLGLLAPRVVFGTGGEPASRRDVLVVVFLRGGADGLNLVVPHGESRYFDLRPRIAVPPPGAEGGALDLDGFFAFHPSAAALLPAWEAGELAVVHAAGSPNETRSHFEAQDHMETGVPGGAGGHDGWLNRHLQQLGDGPDGAFRAVGLGTALPLSLQGEAAALGLSGLDGFSLQVPARLEAELREALARLHGGKRAIDEEAARVFAAMDTLARLGEDPLAANAAEYPPSPLGRQLASVARLLRAGLGLELAAVDSGGWDHHDQQNSQFPGLLEDLARSLAAFRADLGAETSRVTVVTMTEFGRRSAENASLGTDHGRASLMLALGGGVRGGRVLGEWPGLGEGDLYRGDLDVTTDFRTVLAEALRMRRGIDDLAAVFPGFEGPTSLGLFRPVT